MRTSSRLILTLAAVVTAGACGWFDNPTPTDASIQVDGTAGTPVQLIISKQFVAAQNSTGSADLQLFQADTINTTMPVDTVISIAVERQFYVQVGPTASDDPISAHIRIAVDNKTKIDSNRTVPGSAPFRYVYVFNSAITSINEVI